MQIERLSDGILRVVLTHCTGREFFGDGNTEDQAYERALAAMEIWAKQFVDHRWEWAAIFWGAQYDLLFGPTAPESRRDGLATPPAP